MSRRSKKKQRNATAVQAGGDSRAAVAGVCVLLVALVFIVFGQTMGHGFVNFDDGQYVYENPVVSKGLTMQGVAWAFTHSHAGNWHPLTTLSHMLDCQAYGLKPWGHHLTNVLLHAAAAVLLFLMLREMTGALWCCALAAAVFAIHPLRVESVAWVAERKDVLSGVFFMLTLWAYARYARRPESWRRYAMVWLWLALGLMCKPMLVTVPFVLLLLDYWPLGRLRQKSQFPRLAWEKLPLFALSAASCLVTTIVQAEAIQPMEHFPLSQRLGDAVVAYCVYLKQTIYPAGLAVFVPILKNGWPAWQVFSAILLLAALTAAAWILRKKQPWLIVGWLWYLGMLVPVIGILQVGGQAYADRYTYLPQIGLCIAGIWAMAELAREWRLSHVALGSVAAAIVCVLGVAAFHQTTYWRDSETLWTRSLDCTGENYLAHNNLGSALFQRGQVADAIGQYREALRTNPDYAEARNNLGNALFQEGQTLLQHGKIADAIPAYREALLIHPADAQAHDNLGSALLEQGQTQEAIGHYREALQIDPTDAEAGYNLGNALFQQGQYQEGIIQMRKALALKPANADIENTLAWMLVTAPQESLRNGAEAVQLATQARLATGGGDPNILRTLAAAYAETGEFSKAVQTAQNALQIAEARSDASLAGLLGREIKLYGAGHRFLDVP